MVSKSDMNDNNNEQLPLFDTGEESFAVRKGPTIFLRKAVKFIDSDNALDSLKELARGIVNEVNSKVIEMVASGEIVSIDGPFNDVIVKEITKFGEELEKKFTASNFIDRFFPHLAKMAKENKNKSHIRSIVTGVLRKWKGHYEKHGEFPSTIAMKSYNLVMGDGFFSFDGKIKNGWLVAKNLDGSELKIKYRTKSRCERIQKNALKYLNLMDPNNKFGATVIFPRKKGGKNVIVASVQVPYQFSYRPQRFIGLDFNKANENWIYFSEPIDGVEKIDKNLLEGVLIAEAELKKANKNAKVQSSIQDRIDEDGTPIRTGKRSYWRKHVKLVHKLHKRVIAAAPFPGKETRFIDTLVSYLKDNSLGLAIDSVTTGKSNGSFGQDKLKELLQDACLEQGVPYMVVPTYYSTRRCTSCGYVNAEGSRDKKTNTVTCSECGHSENADLAGAKNQAEYAACLTRLNFWVNDQRKQWNKIKSDGNILHYPQDKAGNVSRPEEEYPQTQTPLIEEKSESETTQQNDEPDQN